MAPVAFALVTRQSGQRRRQLAVHLRPPRRAGARRARRGLGDGALARLHARWCCCWRPATTTASAPAAWPRCRDASRVDRLRRLWRLGFPAAIADLDRGRRSSPLATALAGRLDPVSSASHQIASTSRPPPSWCRSASPRPARCASATGSARAIPTGAGAGRLDGDGPWRRLHDGDRRCSSWRCRARSSACSRPAPTCSRSGASLLLIAAVFQLFDGLQAVATGVLRGLGDTRTADDGQPGRPLAARPAGGLRAVLHARDGRGRACGLASPPASSSAAWSSPGCGAAASRTIS